MKNIVAATIIAAAVLVGALIVANDNDTPTSPIEVTVLDPCTIGSDGVWPIDLAHCPGYQPVVQP